MKKIILALVILFTLAAAGCDRKPTDPPKPKTAIGLGG